MDCVEWSFKTGIYASEKNTYLYWLAHVLCAFRQRMPEFRKRFVYFLCNSHNRGHHVMEVCFACSGILKYDRLQLANSFLSITFISISHV